MNNKRKSQVVDTFMEEEMEKCKIFEKFESTTKKKVIRNFCGWKENLVGKSQTEKRHFGKWNFPWEPKPPITNSCLRHWRWITTRLCYRPWCRNCCFSFLVAAWVIALAVVSASIISVTAILLAVFLYRWVVKSILTITRLCTRE